MTSDFHSEQITGEFDDVALAEFIQRFFPFEAGTKLSSGVIVLPHSHHAGHLRRCFEKDEHPIAPEEIPDPGRYRLSPEKEKFLKYPME